MSHRGKVLIAAPVHHILTDWLTAGGYECVLAEQITQEQAFQLVSDCIGIVTSTRLDINHELIDAAPQLRWIGRMGSGMEIIDVPYAISKGIKCYSSPEGNMNAVAEHALGMLLALNKRIIHSNNEIKQGLWIRDANRGVEIEGKTIAIIGFGHTGSAFAKKLSGFGAHVLAYDKYDKSRIPKQVIKCRDLSLVYKEADIVSFHVPLQEDTIHYMNEEFIENMKKPFVLINTSRGGVVDARAMYNGLLSHKISGACIDVWEEEPIEKMNVDIRHVFDEMANMPNVVLTPHIAGYSVESLYKMSKILLEKIVITG